jgi:hypothetical protein
MSRVSASAQGEPRPFAMPSKHTRASGFHSSPRVPHFEEFAARLHGEDTAPRARHSQRPLPLREKGPLLEFFGSHPIDDIEAPM